MASTGITRWNNSTMLRGSKSGSYACYGWITTSATVLYVYFTDVRLPRNVSSISFSALTLACRLAPSGGYVGGASGFNAYSAANTRAIEIKGREVRMMLTKTSGTWGTNNSTFVGSAAVTWVVS